MKKKLISRLLVGALLVTSILPLAGNTSAYATDQKKIGWNIEDGNWYYLDTSGVMQKNKTLILEGKKYVLGSDGAWIE